MALPAPNPSESRPADGGLQGTVPVIEETANVQVVEVDQGGWRITKKVSVTDQQIDEELQDFSVQIERRPMGTQLEGTEVPQARYEGSTLVISVVEEVLVTEKRLVLVEELRITGVHDIHRGHRSRSACARSRSWSSAWRQSHRSPRHRANDK